MKEKSKVNVFVVIGILIVGLITTFVLGLLFENNFSFLDKFKQTDSEAKSQKVFSKSQYHVIELSPEEKANLKPLQTKPDALKECTQRILKGLEDQVEKKPSSLNEERVMEEIDWLIELCMKGKGFDD